MTYALCFFPIVPYTWEHSYVFPVPLGLLLILEVCGSLIENMATVSVPLVIWHRTLQALLSRVGHWFLQVLNLDWLLDLLCPTEWAMGSLSVLNLGFKQPWELSFSLLEPCCDLGRSPRWSDHVESIQVHFRPAPCSAFLEHVRELS